MKVVQKRHSMKLTSAESLLTTFILSFILIQACTNKSSDSAVISRIANDIGYTTASSGGEVDNKKNVEFRSRGVCWSTLENPTLENNKTDEGSGKGSYISRLTGLKPGVTYYLRAYAVTGVDTIYGNDISFTTLNYGRVTDIEGNRYKTIVIGSRTWMAENLRTTRYTDSTLIPNVKDADTWASLSTPAYCWYKNSEAAFKSMYGAIYNWYTVNTARLCPEGWHVPADTEWDDLTLLLGGEKTAGGKLKETGDSYWSTPNAGATNEYRFSSLPGGLRYYDGNFRDFGFGGYFWSSSEFSNERAFFRFMFYEDASMYRFDNDKKNGFYVRCIKD